MNPSIMFGTTLIAIGISLFLGVKISSEAMVLLMIYSGVFAIAYNTYGRRKNGRE
jgi:hypothetical protein